MCIINKSAYAKKSLETYLMILVYRIHKTLSCGPLHMDEQKQDDQLKPT